MWSLRRGHAPEPSMVQIRTTMDDRHLKKRKCNTVRQMWIETESKWCEEANPFGLELAKETPGPSRRAHTPTVRTPKIYTPQRSRRSHCERPKAASGERKEVEHMPRLASPPKTQTSQSRPNRYQKSNDLSTLLTRMVRESRNQLCVLRHAKSRDVDYDQQIRELEQCRIACQKTLYTMDELVAPSARRQTPTSYRTSTPCKVIAPSDKMHSSVVPPCVRGSDGFKQCKVQQRSSWSSSMSPMRSLQSTCVRSLPARNFQAHGVPPMRLHDRRASTS